MQAYFVPADWERVCLTKLRSLKHTGSVDSYINKFNVALNRCDGLVSDAIAMHMFESGLQAEIALQVYNARCGTLADAQQVAQSAALALNHASNLAVPKRPKNHRFIPRAERDSSNTRGSGSGPKPMVVDAARAAPKDKKDVVCYNCRQRGHYANECPQKARQP